MSETLAKHYLEDAARRFRATKELAERALAQLTDEELFRAPDAESNSVAVIMKHMSGNMLSRWTDFLTSDGEKPGRSRDAEFDAAGESRETMHARWEEGWSCLFAALDGLTPVDLLRTVTIRGEPHTVVEAINRQLTHYSYHVGQIVFLARSLRGDTWQTLSIARGRSDAFNAEMLERQRQDTSGEG
ncbi:MAG TPA: DUF1572 family protein [Pyrinomonadaceae bacterium]|nr:DUF1572 family protein [Pyrinomonadaceae bacterium]